MKGTILLLSALAVLCVAGCSKSDPDVPKVDPAAAKAQPGANTPAAAGGGAPESQLRSEKSGG